MTLPLAVGNCIIQKQQIVNRIAHVMYWSKAESCE